MTKLKKFLAKLSQYQNIHVVGASGTEGSEIAIFLHKHTTQKITLHDYANSPETFRQNFNSSHASLPKDTANSKWQKLQNLPNTLNLSSNYLKEIEDADLIFVPQSWYLYPQNSKLHALKDKIPFSSMTRLYLELFEGTTIGITGSNGKSTTTALIYHLLKSHYPHAVSIVGNDRRTPQLLESLESFTPQDLLVLEISNRQLVDTEGVSPQIAVLTNITENHLAEHKNFAEYIYYKSRIFLYQSASDHAILNANDPVSLSLQDKVPSTLTFFKNLDPKIQYPNFTLSGAHNAQNLSAAIEVAHLFNISDAQINDSLSSFSPLPGRAEIIRKTPDLIFINDRQGTATDATIKAIQSLRGNITLIFGGINKGMPTEKLCEVIRQFNVLPIGIQSPFIDECAPQLPTMIKSSTLSEAVHLACEKTTKPGTIIFSPACEYGPYFSSTPGHPDAENFAAIVKNLPI